MPPRAAHLPDAVVGLGPGLLHELDQLDLQPPGIVERIEVMGARDVQQVHHLADHVVLNLGPRQVADADRPAVGVAPEPGQLELGQPPLAADAVERLHLLGHARHRPEQPPPPGERLVAIARLLQRVEREGRVAQPAETIVPVARAADLLGKRGGRCRDDRPGRGMGQRLQRDQRAHHPVAPGSLVVAPSGPVAPPGHALGEPRLGVDRRRLGEVRAEAGEHERHGLAGGDREAAAAAEARALERHRRADDHRVGAAGRVEPVRVVADPGDDRAVVEAEHDLGRHLDPARAAAHQPHEVGRVLGAGVGHETRQ